MSAIDLSAPEIWLSFAITWAIGLSPPLLARFLIVRRPLTRGSAVAFCAIFWLLNVVLFTALGSQSKTHAALLFIAFVSYAILTKGKPPESSPKGVLESHTESIAQGAVGDVVSGKAPALAPTVTKPPQGEGVKTSSVLLRLAKRGIWALVLSPIALLAFCLAVREYPPVPVFVLVSGFVSIAVFLLLSAISALRHEPEEGWRRLTLVLTGLAVVAGPFFVLFYNEDGYWDWQIDDENELIAAAITGAAAFCATPLVILRGRDLCRWVVAGFHNRT